MVEKMTILSEKISKYNFKLFIWHSFFLSFAQSLIDIDTVMPTMIAEAGGTALHIGIMTTIMMGGSSFTQLLFAPMINHFHFKKIFLLIGINLRILSLLFLSLILYISINKVLSNALWYIFILIAIFAFSGAFANISYIDILGKSISSEKRKVFFSARQIIGGIVVILTAFWAKIILSKYNYPANYSLLFLLSGSSLLVASLGFWRIKEVIPSGSEIKSIRNFLVSLQSELKNNPKLKYFLGFINTHGITTSILPFVILYAKEIFSTTSTETGSYLLFKIIGSVGISMFVLIFNQKLRFNTLLYSNILLSVIMSVSVLSLSNSLLMPFLFMLGGIIVSLYSISMNGLLLEISGTNNRAIYTGFAGAGNIIPMIFPLVASNIIEKVGYITFFMIFIILIILSGYFIYKIGCKK